MIALINATECDKMIDLIFGFISDDIAVDSTKVTCIIPERNIIRKIGFKSRVHADIQLHKRQKK